ncbi:hypothetical protein EV207_13224 [Scopulibacillus darangshiensis]|uniref:Uncharacterized protein n=1 Tax=Scopulibacillus darangshiensis TaxID=442528 RepID=A0A4R2NQ50_9BACL|nr:hypothetical protein EV207_13224 [Scopulibacillus darangshiensis]
MLLLVFLVIFAQLAKVSIIISTGFVSVILIVIAVAISGSAAISGDSSRANHAYEGSDDRKDKLKWTMRLLFAAIPCLLATVFHYLLLIN